MKKTALLLILVLLFSLSACAAAPVPDRPDGGDEKENGKEKEIEEIDVELWVLDSSLRGMELKEEDSEPLYSAAEGYAGASFIPCALLATKDGGHTYAYLCLNSGTSKLSADLAVVIVEKEVGDWKISEVKKLDLREYAGKDVDSDAGMKAEGWDYYPDNEESGIGKEVGSWWITAYRGYAGEPLTPIAVLGYSAYGGETAHAVLCQGGRPLNMYVSCIVTSEDGKASVRSMKLVDIGAM